MASHGGFFLNYYSSKEVTHIICANLPDSKIKHKERTKERCAPDSTLHHASHARARLTGAVTSVQGSQAHRAARVDSGLLEGRRTLAGAAPTSYLLRSWC